MKSYESSSRKFYMWLSPARLVFEALCLDSEWKSSQKIIGVLRGKRRRSACVWCGGGLAGYRPSRVGKHNTDRFVFLHLLGPQRSEKWCEESRDKLRLDLEPG
jgi:hypothetical protein